MHCTFDNLYFELMRKRCVIKITSYAAASKSYNILLVLKTNWTICNVFKPRLTANCTFFFMALLVSLFSSTGSNIDVTFCRSTNLVTVGIGFKYSFTFRPKKIVQFKQYKITTDTNVTAICDSLK